jgi:formamidopyrimidine-DNA glycosylase
MPELPEVETVRRGLEPHLNGQRIAAITLRRKDLRVPFPKDLQARIEGRRIERLSRRAKYLLLECEGGEIVILHLGMSGQVIVTPDINAYSPKKHDHMIVKLESGAGFVFNDARRFGMVMLDTAETLHVHPAFAGMGPEPLGNYFSGPVLRMRLSARKTALKLALLDQRVVAGIGNIYASEALHQARLSPFANSASITMPEAERLTAAIRDVLTRAIEAGGSSLKDYRTADGELGYFQHSFRVYDRDGTPCPHGCVRRGKPVPVQKMVQGARATYFCPACQKGRKAA